MNVAHTITVAGFCAGVGMLEEGVRAAFDFLGIRSRTALLCEWEAYASSILLERMEQEVLEPCPIWCGDLAELDLRHMAGKLDVFCAGLPCTPYSVAGKQLGAEDERSFGADNSGPVPHFLRLVAECSPSLVFIENVPPFISGGHFRSVGQRLCELGYTIKDPIFLTAQAVGASHRRERVFILAHRSSERWREAWSARDERRPAELPRDGRTDVADAEREPRSPEQQRKPRRRRAATADGSVPREPGPNLAESAERGQRELWQPSGSDGQPDGRGEDVDDSASPRRPQAQQGTNGRDAEQQGGECVPGDGCGELGNTDQPGLERRSVRERERADERITGETGLPLFAPGPNADWQKIPEWLWPATQPGVRELASGMATDLDAFRADQLRCAGNGVVPLCAATALVELLRRMK